MNPDDIKNMLEDPEKIEEIKNSIDINQIRQLAQENPEMLKEAMKLLQQIKPRVKKIPPNSPCPCDSGKKYKKCCFLSK